MFDEDDEYESLCSGCKYADTWECSVCSVWHDWIGDDDYDPDDI